MLAIAQHFARQVRIDPEEVGERASTRRARGEDVSDADERRNSRRAR